jgi:hypothetical protein
MGTLFSTSKHPICFLLLFGTPSTEYAQNHINKASLDPYLINVAGHSWENDTHIIDWSIGESPMATTFSKHPLYLLSSGFLQNLYDPLLLYQSQDSFDLQIKVGPNPFYNHFYIQCKQDGIVITAVQLRNFKGALVYHFPGVYSGYNYYQEFIIPKLSYPICYLYLYYNIGENTHRTKIIKLIQNQQ